MLFPVVPMVGMYPQLSHSAATRVYTVSCFEIDLNFGFLSQPLAVCSFTG